MRCTRWLVALLSAALSSGCGGASVDPDANGGQGGAGGTTASGAGGTTASGAGGDGGSSETDAPWIGTDAEHVDVGSCVFEDPGIELEVRYEILYADRRDGAEDGSAGPETVTRLDVVRESGSTVGLECLVNLEELSLAFYGEGLSPISLAPIAGLSRLRELVLAGPFVIADAFAALPLEEVTLRRLELTDLQDVAMATSIRNLWLTDVPLTNLSGAERLTALEWLRVDGAALADITALAQTSSLTRVDLLDVPSLTSLAGLESHTGLENLQITEAPIDSLLPLAGLSALESVSIASSQLSSLAGLEGKPNLTSLGVRDAAVSDISALSDSPALAFLYLIDNDVDDLSALSGCTKLATLDVSGNAIESLAPLANLAALEGLTAGDNLLTAIDVALPEKVSSLYLPANQLTSLEPLAGHALTSLDISSNPLVSLAPLFDLPELTYLAADDVGATDLESFPLSTLTNLRVRYNQIESVASLQGLGDLSVDLTGNDVVSLPAEFVGPAAPCGGLVLLDNPLDDAAKTRLELLCDEGNAAYAWDGGSCQFCPLTP